MTDFSIALIKSEFRVDSRTLAPFLDQRHRTILELLDKYPKDFEELNPLTVETEKGVALPQGGFAKPSRYYMLTEDQCYLLLTYSKNTDEARKRKIKLVKAFRDARTNGSKNADMYYMTITKMTNAALNIDAGRRDSLETRKLDEIKMAETMVKIAISDGLNAGLGYKEIYKLCKYRVSSIAQVLLG